MTRKFNNETPPKDNQDLFDRACERLITHFDWGQCKQPMGRCAYRQMEDGQMNCCVIGYVIPDWPEIHPKTGLYAQAPANKLMKEVGGGQEWLAHVHPALVFELQTIHDNIEMWISRHRMWRRLQGLTHQFPELNLVMNPKFNA